MLDRCPGSESLRVPAPEYFRCCFCGGEIELWSDEDAAKCPKCGRMFSRSQKLDSCRDWCKYAKYCRIKKAR